MPMCWGAWVWRGGEASEGSWGVFGVLGVSAVNFCRVSGLTGRVWGPWGSWVILGGARLCQGVGMPGGVLWLLRIGGVGNTVGSGGAGGAGDAVGAGAEPSVDMTDLLPCLQRQRW